MFVELRELLCSGAIRRHQLGAKDLLTPTSSYDGLNGISCCSARCLCGIMESMVCQGCPRNLHLIKNNTVIDEELSVFTNVHPERKWPKGNRRLHERKTLFFQRTKLFLLHLPIFCLK